MKLLVALLLLLQQPPPPLATGRIEGLVLRGESKDPVSGARITVSRVNPATGATLPVLGFAGGGGLGAPSGAPLPPLPEAGPAATAPRPPLPIPPVQTDRDGRFIVPGLEEGSYRVAVTLDGYVRQEYGQRVFPGQGTPLKLVAGEVLRDIVVRLTPTAAINGRVTDNEGKPAAGVQMQLVRVAYNAAGQRILQLPTRATTNDRGEYRLYWITPGRYYLAAGTPPGNTSPIQPDWYPFIFYPNTTGINRAFAIDVKSGSEAVYDVVVPRPQPYKIRGRVVDGSSNKPSTLALSLAYASIGGGIAYQHYSQSYDPVTGLFEIPDLPPGNYIVQANSGSATAQVPVEITNADVEGVIILISPGINLAGQIRVDGGGAVPPAPTRIQLRRIVPGISNYVGFAPNAQAAADGTFKLAGVLGGEYRVVITPPQDYYVKSAELEGRDVLGKSLELAESRAPASGFEIIISPNVAQIDGVATTERLQPTTGVRVVLVPERNRERTELFVAATTDQSGRFGMRRVAPGDYRLFAWEAIENNGYFDPDLLKRFEPQSTVVRVDEGAKLSLEAKVIPAEAK
jgi:5-hydroxyisourate hydrolase-like protein (transthyretin family)